MRDRGARDRQGGMIARAWEKRPPRILGPHDHRFENVTSTSPRWTRSRIPRARCSFHMKQRERTWLWSWSTHSRKLCWSTMRVSGSLVGPAELKNHSQSALQVPGESSGTHFEQRKITNDVIAFLSVTWANFSRVCIQIVAFTFSVEGMEFYSKSLSLWRGILYIWWGRKTHVSLSYTFSKYYTNVMNTTLKSYTRGWLYILHVFPWFAPSPLKLLVLRHDNDWIWLMTSATSKCTFKIPVCWDNMV